MKRFLILSMLVLCIASLVYGVGPTKYTSQNVLCLAFRDSDGNALSFSTQLSAQNVLNLAFNDNTNALSCTIVGEFTIDTMTGVSTMYWIDGSTWTSTLINMGPVSIRYADYQIAVSTDFAVDGNFYLAPGTAYTSTGNVDGSWSFGGAGVFNGDVSSDANSLNAVAVSTQASVDNASDISDLQATDVLAGEATAQLKIDLDAEEAARIAADDLTADATKQNKIEIDNNSERIDDIAITPEIRFLYSSVASSYEYYETSTTPQSTPVTLDKPLTGTGIIVSSWVVDMGNITTILKGEWHAEIYAKVNNPNATKLWFDIYDGTGAAIADPEYYITSTALTSDLSQTLEEYFVYVTTEQYTMKTQYLSFVMKANEVGPDPILSYAMGGSFDSHVHFPVIRAEVSVTQIIPGTNTNVTPEGGRGEVAINVDESPTFLEVFISSLIASGANGLYLLEDGGLGIFIQDSTGWIGIGTNTPGRALDVAGEFQAHSGIFRNANPDFKFEDTTVNDDDWRIRVDGDIFLVQQRVGDATWTTRFSIDGSGNFYHNPGTVGTSTETASNGNRDIPGEVTGKDFTTAGGNSLDEVAASTSTGVGAVWKSISFFVPGDSYVTTGISYAQIGYGMTLTSATATVTIDGTPPQGSDGINFNIMISTGETANSFVSIFNSTSSLQLVVGSTWTATNDFIDTTVSSNDVFRLDIGQVGSTTAGGSPIVVTLYGKQD